MKPVLHLRSLKANLARVVKAQLKLAAQIDRLNEQFADLLESGDCGVPSCPVHHGGFAPYCPAAYYRPGDLSTNDDQGQRVEHTIVESHEVEQASGVVSVMAATCLTQ